MPTYNRVDMLKNAVNSFINQTYKDAILFILDNGSTDSTADYLKQYESHPRIRIVTSNVNIIPPNNFNVLLNEYAYGDLVCHLHDDDELTMDSISLRVAAFKKDPSLQVVYGGWITNGQAYQGQPPDKNRILKDEYINFLTMMWRIPEVDGTFDKDLRYYHDWLFKIKCLQEYKVGYIQDPVIKYTIHLGQASIECRNLGMNGIEEKIMRNKLKEKYGI